MCLKLPSLVDFDSAEADFIWKYFIWGSSEPENGSALCQLVLEKHDGGFKLIQTLILGHFKMKKHLNLPILAAAGAPAGPILELKLRYLSNYDTWGPHSFFGL